MAQSKAFVDASHSLNELSHALALLESENARLRSELESVGTAAYLYGRSDLKAENAKLRELVRIAVKHCDSGTCDGCPILGEDESCPYSDMARELGMEVDE